MHNAKHPIFYRTRGSLEKERRYNGLLNPPKVDSSPYNLYQENSLRPNTVRLQAFSGIHEATPLNQAFLSQENLDYLQDRIRYEVYKRSNKKYQIGRQSDIDLQIIMRSIYLQYAKNQKNNIKQQVNELNELVIQEATPKIMSQVQQYHSYLNRASGADYMPLAHPESMSAKGRKQLVSVTKLWT